jgi:hypothetical protein
VHARSRKFFRLAGVSSSADSRIGRICCHCAGFMCVVPFAHFSEQPRPGGSPTALDSGWGNSEAFGSVFNRKARKVAKLDNAALLSVQFR